MHVPDMVKESGDLGEISPIGWVPNEDLSYEDWEYAMQGFFLAHKSLNWIIGDGLNFGESRYGEMYAQAIECTGWAYQRLADAKWVAAAVPIENRREALTWTHHRHVASLPPPAQEQWLARAEEESWTTTELYHGMNGIKSRSIVEPIIVKPIKRSAERLFMELASLFAANSDKDRLQAWFDNVTREERWDEWDSVWATCSLMEQQAQEWCQ